MRKTPTYTTGEGVKRHDVVRRGKEVYWVIHYSANGLLVENAQGGHGGDDPADYDLIGRYGTSGDARNAVAMGGFDHGDLIS